MDIKEIKGIIDLMRKNGLTEFEYEKDGTKIRIRRGPDGEPQIVTAGPGLIPAPTVLPVSAGVPLAVPPSAAPISPTSPNAPATPTLPTINSPMVGTFYSSPAPDAPAYVEVGTAVNTETVVCIIEAMKVMNEIKAEMSGTIVEILAENGKPVEFGKPLFRIKPV
ncbi:MAG: acetyl-CoA carboxylase biotin carboxyl carrier protein [Verrucomicrobia bacterium]|nr:acetyl-CoA carboxylase biotin carboxyl carrier protein [Verrucomicrobiota bacterium]NBU68740.1 acetyl-CoA carboxylase biotin carboxyl carrier protein [Verrucomicrobiota bacterium]